MVIINNTELMSIIVKVMNSLKRVNGFNHLIRNVSSDREKYLDLLNDIEKSVIESLLRSEHIILETVGKQNV